MASFVATATAVFIACCLLLGSARADCSSQNFTSGTCSNMHYDPMTTYMSVNCSRAAGGWRLSGMRLRDAIVFNTTMKELECAGGTSLMSRIGNTLDRQCPMSTMNGSTLLAHCWDFEMSPSSVGYHFYNRSIDVGRCVALSGDSFVFPCAP